MVAAMDRKIVTLGELLGNDAGALAALKITDIVLDSRDVHPGCAFVALDGARTHGLQYASQARAKGAVVVLYDPATSSQRPGAPSVPVPRLRDRLGELAHRFYARKPHWPIITAVTGTNGKTTVTYLLAQALTLVGRTGGYIGTLGYGVPPELVEHRLTTPDCFTVHREIALMPVADVVMEASSHGLDQNRLDGLAVAGAVFTNLTHDHLDAHGSFAHYGEIKTKLFVRPELDHAVINMDDAFAPTLHAALSPDVHALGVTLRDAPDADIQGRIVKHGLDGQEIEISGAYGPAVLRTALIGEFNAMNLLLALGALLNLDVPIAEACTALGACSPPPGRMESFGGRGGQPRIIVDYAHTPDALTRALQAVRDLAQGEVWVVFGCGGDRDRAKRPLMGAAASAADHIVVTDDNPRSEDPAAIVAEIQQGIAADRDVHVEHDRAAAIAYAVGAAAADDVVLVAGRGHERVQQRAEGARDFDDRAVVQAIVGGYA
jgi:UDP-N-acetylmuramoyl-L-alanyl-D-glutamate--2,6-diaminopimelate ligase